MEIDRDTIMRYVAECKTKIMLIENDIQTYEYRIQQSKKEISTVNYFINQYNKALEILNAQEDHEESR